MLSLKKAMSSAALNKFKGSMLGSLIGDCLGAPFEGEDSRVAVSVVKSYFTKLKDKSVTLPYHNYTDDTAMMVALADSLAKDKKFDPVSISKKFTMKYLQDPRRGYGASVGTVFRKLKSTKFADPYGPAKEQFEGRGSFGNGGAMRVAPIALFFNNNEYSMIEYAKLSALITHAHPEGYLGSILQCLAVYEAFKLNKKELNIENYVKNLIEKMCQIEAEYQNEEEDEAGALLFTEKLKTVQQLLEKPLDKAEDDVIECLGNNITASGSVPTAIYCFARSELGKGLEGEQTENGFEEAIKLAIRLGGDTDTIACMTGAISGAYHGDEIIDRTLLSRCEDHESLMEMAEKLFESMPM